MKVNVFQTHEESSKAAALIIAQIIKDKSNAVLGLATGSSPILIYEELIRLNKEGEISFRNIKTFNLDEYCGLSPEHKKSYRYFMNKNFFNKLDIDIKNTSVPSGNGNIEENALSYEKLLSENTIDVQILGIGTNAHIGFNEPLSPFDSSTREVQLAKETIKANQRFFVSESDVPKKAISMGIGSILKARKIILIAFGKNKAKAIKDTVEGRPTEMVPASALQSHADVEIFLDKEAASLLK